MTGSSDNGLSSAIPEAPDTETGIISGSLARFSAFATKRNNITAFTAGVGISPFDVVHLDVAGLIGTDNTYGAVAQFQFTF